MDPDLDTSFLKGQGTPPVMGPQSFLLRSYLDPWGLSSTVIPRYTNTVSWLILRDIHRYPMIFCHNPMKIPYHHQILSVTGAQAWLWQDALASQSFFFSRESSRNMRKKHMGFFKKYVFLSDFSGYNFQ